MTVEHLSPDLSPTKQYDILSRGSVDLINQKEFLEKLKLKRPLRIKAGFDPSRPDIHLGHAILIHKLRQFQNLGHEVIFVIGDFTACIGDPSAQNKTRPLISFEEVKKNADSYIAQATDQKPKVKKSLDEDSQWVLAFFQRLDFKKTKWVYNSSWLNQVSLREFIISISSKFTVARQMERNDFDLRYKSKKPIGMHEFFYPILQAYDSKELKADVEIGGTDQLFNLLLGRDLQEQYQQNPQVVLTFPLLEGLDGKQKMSKSLDNAISVNDTPTDIYGKMMKISDELLIRYWHFFTEGRRELKELFQSKKVHPKKEKENLAWLLVCAFYGQDKADQAEVEFKRVFSNKGLPDQIPEKILLPAKELWVCQMIKEVGLCSSTSEARRQIEGGGIKIYEKEKGEWGNGEKILIPTLKKNLNSGDCFLLSSGRRNFVKVKVKKKV